MEDLKYYRASISFEKYIEAESEADAKETLLEIMDNEPNHIQWQIEEQCTVRKQYKVHGCKEIIDKVEYHRVYTHVEKCAKSDAEFFGVYETQSDGTEQWVADFCAYDDASMYALEKSKEEIE